MMNISTHKRSLVLLSFILTTFFSFAVGRHLNDVVKSRHKRQQGENLYLSGSYIVPGGEDGSGWSDWGPPSPCSRSCGGGVTTQTRTCEHLNYDRTPLCQGGSQKHYSCNTQDCPDGSKDFRSEQCAEHNDKIFENVRYDWIPYTKGTNPCELNCMPKGERFYYQHSSKVVDGTLCNDESLDVCVNGECLPVGCDMMLGSSAREDKCRQCGGDSSSCNTVTGLYDNDDLVVGYNDILLVPEGATHIVIKEQQPSNNYFAIRNKQGEYYLNGNWKIDFPRPFTFAGCIWHYERNPQGFTVPDSLTCIGPTSEPVYLSLLYQGRNVGIKYEYSVPTNIAQTTNEEYTWVHDAFSPCSATCGGGIQIRNVTCTSRQELKEVDDNLCDSGLRPIDNQTCSNIPCPAQWSESEWSECSAACGEGGTQSRQIYCFKIVSHGIPTMVSDDECFSTMGPKPPVHQKCNVGSPCPSWHVGPWNPCDKLCGEGKQRRSVRCYRKVDGKIEVLEDQHCEEKKPESDKACILHPCEGVDWIISEWSGCDSCTSKVKTRTAFCATVKGEIFPSSFCSNHPDPVTQEECDTSSLPKCDAQWYASDWSKCSGKCGEGVQSRRVFCGVFDGESLEKVDDEKCDQKKKYEDTRPCEQDEKDCPAEWHSGPWSSCSKKCGGGEQTRKVLCLRENKTVPITECEEDSILDSSQSCNKQACTDDEVIPVEVGSTQPEDYDDEDWCDEDEEGDEDIDYDFDATTPIDKFGSTSSFDDLMQSDGTSDYDESTDPSLLSTEGSGSGDQEDLTTDFGSGATEITETSIDQSASTDVTADISSTLASTDLSSESSSVESSSLESSSPDSSSTESSSSDSSSSESSTDSSSKDTSSTDSSSSESSTDSSSKDTSSTESYSSESSTDSSSKDTSSTDSSTSDLSSTDSSSTDSSSTESSSTDSSSTDSSSTDSSSTDSSSTDFSSTDYSSTEASSTDSSSTDSSSTDSSSTEYSTSDSSSTVDSSTTESAIDTSTIEGSTKEEVKGEFNPGDDDDDDDVTGKPTTESNTDSDSTGSTLVTEESTADSSTVESSTDGSSSSTEIASTDDSTTDGSSTDGSTTDSSTSDYSTTDLSSTESSTSDYSSTEYSTSDYSSTEYSTSDYSSTEYSTSDYSSTEQSSLASTIFGTEITKPKCKKRPKKPTCLKSIFGCCSDNKTAAEGPFEIGCPSPETCKDTKHGCCPDGVSPSPGPKNKGCPVVPCKETLFGCCEDNKTPSGGNNKEGCPPPPPACTKSKYGCCADNETEAKGPAKKGCPETTTKAPKLEDVKPDAECLKGEFGCCDDGKTAASGPDKRGCCSITEHGCCPDGETSASGPDNEGCETGCTNAIFGCCSDKKTAAHGPLGEGCCLMEEFGCCPDNILAARGPDNEGCGCQWTPYGCCPDNVTTAKGHEFLGCDCNQRPNGCCPDKHTSATGPNYEGCPCHTHQFGCCPDGKRAAKGPSQQGCRCTESEFGCCSDEETPALGPDKEGCDCASSKYGCCPDGFTEAKNVEFEGCEDIPKNLQESCSLEKDRGSCKNYTVNWFYDMEYGGCSRFWYGGCEGNNNNFRSQDECKDVCVEPQGKDVCQLPKVKGPCEGYYPHWYYDAQHKQCVQFVYGGCLGNNNRFQTREDCQKLCEKPAAADQCTLPADQGTCKGNFERWAYNAETLRCEPFTWGGCGGNTNRFNSESACMQRCDSPGKMKDICSLPQAAGNCSEKISKWNFDKEKNRCMPFYFTGCEENKNQFDTEEDCDRNCPQAFVQDICTLPPLAGSCDDYTVRWYYNIVEQRCHNFYYGGCGGNSNNFQSEEECDSRCKMQETTTVQPAPEPFRAESCFLPSETGPCRASMPRWFYDSSIGVCRQFTYGGCNGNQNNFERREECEHYCSSVQDLCQLPMSAGPCEESIRKWFYDKNTDSCSQFAYGGCEGNGNRFETRDECESRCKRGPTEEDSRPVAPEPEPDYDYDELPRRCYSQVEPGNCRGSTPSWFFDYNSGDCRNFLYTGCGGNDNRFVSEEQCQRQCGRFRQTDVCRYERDPGPCNESHRKIYFDASRRQCTEYTYGGCEGGPNRFSSVDECVTVCLQHQEPPPDRESEEGKAICRQQVEIGRCPEMFEVQYLKRWYFDNDRGTCLPFIYVGCGGNNNNFRSYDRCMAICNDDTPSIDKRLEETDPCEEYQDECIRLQCPYGEARSVAQNGCEKCSCNNPCENIICGAETLCSIDLQTDERTGETLFTPVCRSVAKSGECPDIDYESYQENERCETECYTDADCTGSNKCCNIGCSKSCVQPHMPRPFTAAPAYTVNPIAIVPPTFDDTQEPQVEAQEGQVATFTCLVHGNPPPVITWEKDSVTIDGTKNRYVITGNGVLQIVSVYRNDSGTYVCIADNGAGRPIRKEFVLEVKDPEYHRANVISFGENVIGTLGAPLVLRCLAYGWPAPMVKWWRGKTMLPLFSEQYEMRRDNSLLIRSLQISKLGEYICDAYNGQGAPGTWSVKVKALRPLNVPEEDEREYGEYLVAAHSSTVVVTPRPHPVPESPRVEEPVYEPPTYNVPVSVNLTAEQSRIRAGNDLMLHCAVDGYPIPDTYWYKDDEPLQESSRVQISESNRVFIQRANESDAGEYRCEALNTFSRAYSSVTIDIETGGGQIPANCTDNQYFANCSLIVKAQYCNHKFYGKFCCRSCMEAGLMSLEDYYNLNRL